MTAPEPRYEFTPDQITGGIAMAIRDRDLAVVPGLLKLLAVQDPARAQLIFDVIRIALEVAL